VKSNYENPDEDYSLVPGNKFKIDVDTDYTEINDEGVLKHSVDLASEIPTDFRKFVFGCRANNEILPFADS
jgi:hypothetical protein